MRYIVQSSWCMYDICRQHTEAGHYGCYFCEVCTQDGLAIELSNMARVERALDEQLGYSGMSAPQMNQLKGSSHYPTDGL